MAADNKRISLAQMKTMAERFKADSASRLSEALELLIPALEGAQHIGVTVTLPADQWNNRTQTVLHESLLADSNYWYLVGGDADCEMAYSDAGVKAGNVTVNGQMTFRAEITPEEDLTVNIIRLEVEIET